MSARHDAERLLAELVQEGAILVLDDDRLAIDAPPGTLTADRRKRLAGCLPELRTLVAAQWRPRGECIAPRPCRRDSPCAEPVDGRPCFLATTCCLCESALPPGRRYLCQACSATSAAATVANTYRGEQSCIA